MPRANLLDRVEKVIDAARKAATTSRARSQIDSTVICTEGYAEPGYDDPPSGLIAFGDWNVVSRYVGRKFQTIDDTPARLSKRLDRLGVELAWVDEWTCCDGCGKAVRTKPNSYSWRPSYIDDGCGTLICGECLRADPAEYLRALEGRSNACLTVDIDLEQCGYVLVEAGFEQGLYGGQAADPTLIAEALREQGVTRFLFKLDHSGQFDIDFSVWVHAEDASNLDAQKFAGAQKDGADRAENLRAALSDASRKMDECEGQIKIATCDLSTGTASVRTITPQEFVEGKALLR
jgi:hypothetical protein